MKKLSMCLATVVAMAVVAPIAAQSQQYEYTTRTFSCLGSRGICIKWHSKGSNVWHVIKGVMHHEDPYPWGFGSVCPEGSESSSNVFVFDDETGTTGTGYTGCLVCINQTVNKHHIVSQSGTRIFTNYQDWETEVVK